VEASKVELPDSNAPELMNSQAQVCKIREHLSRPYSDYGIESRTVRWLMWEGLPVNMNKGIHIWPLKSDPNQEWLKPGVLSRKCGHLPEGNCYNFHRGWDIKDGRYGEGYSFGFLSNGVQQLPPFMCSVQPNSCTKIAWEDSIGAWVSQSHVLGGNIMLIGKFCNNRIYEQRIPCSDLAKIAWTTGYECCQGSRFEETKWAVSGEVFNHKEGWSLAVGYNQNYRKHPYSSAKWEHDEAPWSSSRWEAHYNKEIGVCIGGSWRPGREDQNPDWRPWRDLGKIPVERWIWHVMLGWDDKENLKVSRYFPPGF
jgi:hypothetical protein